MAGQSQEVTMGLHRYGYDLGEILFDLPGSSVGDPGVADRMGWPVDELRAYRVFDWADGDGLNPLVGGVLTATGAPTYGIPAPWRGVDGSDRTCAIFDAANRLGAAACPAIDDAHDIVSIVLFRVRNVVAVSDQYPHRLGNAAGATGLLLWKTAASMYSLWRGAGPQTATSQAISAGWVLLISVCDRSANCIQYLNGVASAAAAYTAGAMAGPIVAGFEDGGTNRPSATARSIHHVGPGIADLVTAAWVQRLTCHVLGLRPRMGTPGTYARASTRVYYPIGPTGRMHVVANNTPPAGNVEGLGPDEQIVSVASQNHALPAAPAAAYLASHIAPGSDAGIVASAVDDSANLGDAREFGPVVIRLQNPTGGTLYQRLNNVIGTAVAESWASIRAREVAGPVRMGWQTAAGTFTEILPALSAGYARSSGTAVPAADTDRQCLELPAAADVYVIGYCAGTGLGSRIPDEVPSLSAFGTSSTVLQGVITTTVTPSDQKGTIEILATPRFGGGAAPTAAESIVSRSGGATGLIALDGAGAVTTTDGTNTPSATCVEADGIQETLRAAYSAGGMYVARDGQTAAETAYDGALASTGTLIINGGPRSIQGIRVRRAAVRRNAP